MITFKQRGGFNTIEKYLSKKSQNRMVSIMNRYGQAGVKALSEATPIKTGLTAASWDYSIKQSKGSLSLYWSNSNIVDGVPIAIIIQYGHGTPNGSYVEGIDFINPTMKPIFKKLADDMWKEVRG